MNKKKVLGKIIKTPDNPLGYTFDKLENNNSNSNYCVRFTVPEFTSICPVTSQPDFATLVIDYVPKTWLLESKSLKIFIQSFRNYGIFHEDVTILIGKYILKQAKPNWLRVAGFFAPRGGIPIDVFWQSGKIPKNCFVPEISNFIKKNQMG
ncbi:MAG: NADPH-dependent 7-cyano-7-deazaguanine reductase QueF [Rickettsiales bacterium]|nr:NADPH-dependent 7-cyano-7-deazaguanine reductase QueF [Rickettsiales bacterium]|tara:strand:- start:807 stop:1259 length:453 start_codon:yes stop_codon:yes gene_type:complete